jgi:hypothetical protein
MTGEELYNAAFSELPRIAWKHQGQEVKDAFVRAAAVAHQTEVQPLQKQVEALQQLARDWQDYAEAVKTLPVVHCDDFLMPQHARLEARTRALAGEEVSK